MKCSLFFFFCISFAICYAQVSNTEPLLTPKDAWQELGIDFHYVSGVTFESYNDKSVAGLCQEHTQKMRAVPQKPAVHPPGSLRRRGAWPHSAGGHVSPDRETWRIASVRPAAVQEHLSAGWGVEKTQTRARRRGTAGKPEATNLGLSGVPSPGPGGLSPGMGEGPGADHRGAQSSSL